jgi:regulator of extracellular matrix RemA (YlzA/DUF370 family)
LVYVGGDNVVDAREIVAILDARRLRRAPDGRALWARAAGEAHDDEGASGRTVIVTTRGAILAPITPATVARRVRERTGFCMRPRAESQTGRGFPALTVR